MTERWIANPQIPRIPFPHRFELIRQAALARWGETPIPQEEILDWVRAGCPDAAGSLLNAATHQPPIAGQGQNHPGAFVTHLFRHGAFLPGPAECDYSP